MAARHFVDATGKYIGGFDASALPEDAQEAWCAAHIPAGAVEVASAPDNAVQVWDGSAYSPALARTDSP